MGQPGLGKKKGDGARTRGLLTTPLSTEAIVQDEGVEDRYEAMQERRVRLRACGFSGTEFRGLRERKWELGRQGSSLMGDDEVRKIRIELKAGVSVENDGEEGRGVSFDWKFR